MRRRSNLEKLAMPEEHQILKDVPKDEVGRVVARFYASEPAPNKVEITRQDNGAWTIVFAFSPLPGGSDVPTE